MSYTTLITTGELALHLSDPNWAIVDCRFSLADPERGRRDYAQAHIPGAIFAHLNEDLSGPRVPGITGRHPLPPVEFAAARFSAWGIDQRVQVVAYDDSGGSIAARLWWLLRWLGHEAVAVLDGGWPKWKGEARPEQNGVANRSARQFVPHPRQDLLITTAEVEASMQGGQRPAKQSPPSTETASQTALALTPPFRLFDARAADRFHGENETIDPIAGHIPGAISVPYPDNLNPDGSFRSDGELRARFTALLGSTPADHTAFYCGSGVTATHNILVMKHIGLGDAKLYAGSWSEWITDPKRPIEK